VYVHPETDEVYAGGHGHLLSYFKYSRNPQFASPSVMSKVSKPVSSEGKVSVSCSYSVTF
jgi:hypothetical protein